MSQSAGQRIRWEELSWVDIQELVQTTKMVILPCGATEQHGPHLPVGTDTFNATELAERVSQQTGVPVLPALSYGCSLMHGRTFPGTLSLRPQTLMAVFEEVCGWLYSAGIRKVLALNAHYGNYPALQAAIYNLQHDLPSDFQVACLHWRLVSVDVAELTQQDVPVAPQNMHANWAETSCMLAQRPDLVRMDRAVDNEDVPTAFTYRIDQLSASGVVGRHATEATAADGERITQTIVRRITEQVRQMLQESSKQPPNGGCA